MSKLTLQYIKSDSVCQRDITILEDFLDNVSIVIGDAINDIQLNLL